MAEGERQGDKDFPGVRTFAFTALLGALAVLLSGVLGNWIGVALFLAAASFLLLRYLNQIQQRQDVGYTTEIASMCTFSVGALAQAQQLQVATALTIAMVALLRSKRVLHRAADLLSPRDLEIGIRFLVITLIIFPLLPEEPVRWLDAELWLRDVWRMVVLISAVSFAGYSIMRVRGGQAGLAITGLLAGLVSSTAATFAYARAARGALETRHAETLIVLAASASFLRMALVLAVVAPRLLPPLAIPLVALSAAGFGLAGLRHRPDAHAEPLPDFHNPLTLRVALTFAGVYAAVLLLVQWLRESFADNAIYALSAVAAIPGADAPTLSLARLVLDEKLDVGTAVAAIVGVAIATTLAKLGMLAVAGPARLLRRMAPTLIALAAVGALTLLTV